jgi:tetratricopeptide (TPR) repeat protein
MVRNADIYVGVIGLRYGSPVRDQPDLSYTELEFDVAGAHGLPRLIFQLDEHAELPLPADRLIDREHGSRQDAFRRRLQETSTTVAVASPTELETRLYQALVELATAVDESAQAERGGAGGTSVAVPLGRLPMVVRGRKELLEGLLEDRGLTVLAGMGGVGKSTVAAELARLVQADRHVWWVSAGDGSSLTAGIVTVARRLGAREVDLEALITGVGDGPDRFWALLEQSHREWLLVFDGADQPGLLAPRATSTADGTGWVRTSEHGLVLVTTRQAERTAWGRQARIHRLDPLTRDDAADVLLDLAPDAGSRAQAEDLGRRLGGLPLALYLAGTHLGSDLARWHTFDAYWRALDQTPADAELLCPDPDTDQAGNQRATVMHTWEISLDDLAHHGLPEARPVLRLLSCFAPATPIPLDLLSPDHLADLLSVSGASTAGQVTTRLDRALRGLARVGLVNGGSGAAARSVLVHPVVADTNRTHLLAGGNRPDPDPGTVRRIAVALVATASHLLMPELPEDWSGLRRLTPHAHALLAATAPHLDDAQLAVLITAATRIAMAHRSAGATSTSLELTGTALARAGRLGSDHPVVLAAQHELAHETLHQGRLADAERDFRLVLESRRRVLGENDTDTLRSRYGLARVVAYRGRLAEAEEALRALLEHQERVLGREHVDTITTSYQLARVMGKQGRWAEAERSHRSVLDIRTRLLGEEHPSTLTSRHGVARAIVGQGRWTEAESAYRQLLEALRRTLGPDHPNTLTTYSRLADAVAGQRRWEEAEAMYREMLPGRSRTHGEDHSYVLWTRHGLAVAVSRQGRWAEAEGLHRDILDARRRLLGNDHPHTLASRLQLCETLVRMGRRDEAETPLRELLHAQLAVLGEDHPDVAATRRLLVECEARDDHPETAR